MHRTTLSLAVLVAFFLCTQPSPAGPLTEAQVTKVINHVSLIDPHRGDRPAVVRDVVKDDLGVETGTQSRSELLFQDNTLTRLGAETFFSFKTGTRDMSLEKGSMLLQVPKGLGGAKIHTAAVTAAITGTTIMMEYIPQQYIKVLVLEGSLRLSRNGLFGDSVVLKPGKMVIMRPDAKKIPDPMDVDLEHVVQTSSLVNFPGSEPLPSTQLIQAAIQQQQQQLATRSLVPTNLVMGQGTNVIVATSDQLAKLTSPTTGLLGATLTSSPVTTLKNDVLPIVNNLGTTLGATTGMVTGTVDTLLTSATGTPTTTASDLLGSATGTVTSIPISSSTQVTSLLDAAVGTSSGIATVAPTMTTTLSRIAPTVSTTIGSVTPVLSAVTSTTSTTSTSTTTTSPTIVSTLTTTSTTLPILTSQTSTTPVTTSAPSPLTSTTSVLGLGH